MANVAALRVGEGRAGSRADLDKENDTGLARRYIGGDDRAFAELHRRFSRQILNYLHRMIGDRERAEDLTQETWLRVCRHIRNFDQRRAFSSWIYAIANNLARDELRKRAVRNECTASDLADDAGDSPGWLDIEDPDGRPDDLHRRRVLKAQVHEALRRLSDRHRSVLVLRELQGKTYGEIAEITGWPLGTVRSRLNRARARFAEVVGPLLA